MVELAQSEIAGSLPSLLESIDSQSVVICRDGQRVGAIVSMERFEQLKKFDLDRMDEISRTVSARVAAHASELGLSPEELVARLLEDEG